MPADRPYPVAPRPCVGVDLRAAFGLTAAEERVVRRLAQGYSLNRMAVEFGISSHTVRSQLKRALSKADVHSQVELVVRVFTLEQQRRGAG